MNLISLVARRPKGVDSLDDMIEAIKLPMIVELIKKHQKYPTKNPLFESQAHSAKNMH